MTKQEKRLKKIKQNPRHVRFDDLDRVLIHYGFERTQSGKGTSHYYYILEEYRLSIPYKRPFLKVVYVKEALKILEEIERES